MNHVKPLSLVVALMFSVVVGATQDPAQKEALSKTANPDLVGALAKELKATPAQAEGAAGSLFSLAKTRLSPGDWSKVAGAVPGMNGLLKAAPQVAVGTGGIGAIAGQAAGLASAASAFSKLGLSPDLVAKAIPVLTSFVGKSGGADVAKLLTGVLK